MKNKILIILIGILTILLIPFVIAQICPYPGELFFGELVQPDGTILGDYDNDCIIGSPDVGAVNLAINGRLDCIGLNYNDIPYSLDINGDGVCTELDKSAISAKSVGCTDDDEDFWFVCINTPTLSHDFGGTKDCDDENININPDAVEAYGNEVDEDCTNADFVLNGIVDDEINNLYNALIDLKCDSTIKTGFTNNQEQLGYYYLDQLNTPKQNCHTEVSKSGYLVYSGDNYNVDVSTRDESVSLVENTAIAGRISGYVSEEGTLNSISGAMILVKDYLTQETVQIVFSNGEMGEYIINGLPVTSTYDLSAELDGYTPSSWGNPVTNIGVNAGETKLNNYLWLKGEAA